MMLMIVDDDGFYEDDVEDRQDCLHQSVRNNVRITKMNMRMDVNVVMMMMIVERVF